MHPGTDPTSGQSGAHFLDGSWLEKAISHIVLASPHNLNGLADRPRDLDRLIDIVHLQAPSETSAQKSRVNMDGLRAEAERLDDVLQRCFRGLCRHPHFTGVLPNIRGTIHRFEWRVCLERILVNSFKPVFSGAQSCTPVAFAANRIAL